MRIGPQNETGKFFKTNWPLLLTLTDPCTAAEKGAMKGGFCSGIGRLKLQETAARHFGLFGVKLWIYEFTSYFIVILNTRERQTDDRCLPDYTRYQQLAVMSSSQRGVLCCPSCLVVKLFQRMQYLYFAEKSNETNDFLPHFR